MRKYVHISKVRLCATLKVTMNITFMTTETNQLLPNDLGLLLFLCVMREREQPDDVENQSVSCFTRVPTASFI